MVDELGDDHLELGVQLPNGQKLMPIPKMMLRIGTIIYVPISVVPSLYPTFLLAYSIHVSGR